MDATVGDLGCSLDCHSNPKFSKTEIKDLNSLVQQILMSSFATSTLSHQLLVELTSAVYSFYEVLLKK
jgi:hypothetical protein